MEEQLLDTWNIHNRINLYLLDAIPPEALGGISASKGRSVGEQFAHMHNVRLMWLKVAAPELLEGLAKIEKEQASDKPLLLRSLAESGGTITALLRKGIEAGGKIKGFKPHVLAFLGYLISHESYHRGEIGIILTQSGHQLDKKVEYGMWEWGVR
ncbi:MAG: DinB family protein [Chloroflexota bacterium]|nr:DinB family protein [Chloroflexota bacterium]